MRIIAGKDRGRPIEAPSKASTRPTVDRVRESIMSAVFSSLGGFEGLYVLDLFAGSGALGIESLSRGCDFVAFNDCDKEARKCIEGNLSKLGYGRDKCKICSLEIGALSDDEPDVKHVDALLPEVTAALRVLSAEKPFDLVFLDPPYKTSQEKVMKLAASMYEAPSISPDALIVYEHDRPADEAALDSFGLELLKEKKYGSTYVSYIGAQGR